MPKNPDVPITGLILTMTQICEVELHGRHASPFADIIWEVAGCDESRLDASSRSFALAAWREGLAQGSIRNHEILSRGAERGNLNAAAVLHTASRRAVADIREVIIARSSSRDDQDAADALARVDASAAAQRALLMGDDE